MYIQPSISDLFIFFVYLRAALFINQYRLSQQAGVDAKASSDQRGHGLGVMEVYTMSDRQQKRQAVKRLENMVRQATKMSA